MKILSDVGNVILTSVGSLIALFVIAKLLGARQISQLSMFDYVVGITIGSIAAEFATSLEGDFLKPLTAMLIYVVVAMLMALVSRKNQKLREFLQGRPLVLYKGKKIYRGNLKKAKMNLSELLSHARVAGYFDLADLSAIVLEESGQLSFLPTAQSRPITPQDLQLNPEPEKLTHNIIMDGRLIECNLEYCGLDINWLQKQLNAEDTGNIEDVMLGIYDGKKLTVYKAKKQTDIPERLV